MTRPEPEVREARPAETTEENLTTMTIAEFEQATKAAYREGFQNGYLSGWLEATEAS